MYDGCYMNLLAQLERLFRHNRQGSYKTRQRYFEAGQRFCRFLAREYRLQKLTNCSWKHISAYVENMRERGLSASTIKTDLAAIRFWHDKMDNPRNKLPRNDSLSLERRSYGGADRAWSQQEYERMLAICNKNGETIYGDAVTLGRYMGLRIHEVFRIDTAIAELALRTGVLHIKGKNGKMRELPLHAEARGVFCTRLKMTGRGQKLFVPEDVQSDVMIKRMQAFIAEHRQEARDEDSMGSMTFHGLRHLAAMEWYGALRGRGLNDYNSRVKVSQWLGHDRVEVTNIYLAGTRRKGKEKQTDGE